MSDTFIPQEGDNPVARGEVRRVTRIDQPQQPVQEERTEVDFAASLAAIFQQEREMARLEREFMVESQRTSARATMAKILATYGLDSLTDYTFNEVIANPTVDISNPDAILFKLREQPKYQERFAANQRRLTAGLPELDPASYIALEDQFRTVMRSNGLPAGFYDQTGDFTELIAGDVSPLELQTRVEQGFRAVDNADPEVLRQLREFYPEVGQSREQLAAYFLDPQKAEPIITRQVRAAQIAARGRETGGIQITGALAEDLARRGVTVAEAERGFTEIGALGELTQAFAGEEALTQEQIVRAKLAGDVTSQQELERRARRRVAEFQGGGGFARTTGATSGTISTAVGEAQ